MLRSGAHHLALLRLMDPIRTVLIVAGLGAAIAAGVWFVYTSVSYGPLEERTGRVVRAGVADLPRSHSA